VGEPLGDLLEAAARAEAPTALADAVRASGSLDDLVARLRAEPGVASVAVSDHLVKTHPPMKELRVDLRRVGAGSIVLDVSVGPGALKLAGTHPP
jgi:hypothetical protein